MSIQERVPYSDRIAALTHASIAPTSELTRLPSTAFFRSASAKESSSNRVGRTLATARSLGLFPGRRNVRNQVGRKVTNFYRFTLNELSNVRLSFQNRSQSSIVGRLLNEQGQVVSLGRNRLSERVRAGEMVKRSFEAIPSGTYYLKVSSRGAGKNAYRLTLAASNTVPFPCGCGQSS